jgi:hypothetical protein
MKETGLLKCQEIPLRGPPSPHVAGADPRSTRSGKCTSAASSQGALVHQDTLKKTLELQKNHHVKSCLLFLICSLEKHDLIISPLSHSTLYVYGKRFIYIFNFYYLNEL